MVTVVTVIEHTWSCSAQQPLDPLSSWSGFALMSLEAACLVQKPGLDPWGCACA